MIILFLFLITPLFGQSFFESDGLGIAGKAVDSIGHSQWVLEVSDVDGLNRRTLYNDQKEVKRWDRTSYLENNQYLIKENYYYKNSLRTEMIQLKNGEILEETSYDSSGAFLDKKKYIYDQENRLASIETFDQEGIVLKKIDLLYRHDNSLRGMQSHDGNSVEWRTGDFDKHYLDTLYINENKETSIFQYKGNDLAEVSTIKNETVYKEVFYEYDSKHNLVKEHRFNYPENSRIDITYNSSGSILTKYTYKNENLESTENNEYSGTRLIKTIQKSRGLKLEWNYEYRGNESDPYKTTYLKNGTIIKESETSDEGIVEIFYRKGIEFLRRVVKKENNK